MLEFGTILLCYLIGSIPFSYLFTRIFRGVDIRTIGSGNVGATNVLRSAGIAVAIPALAGDLCKGILGAWLGFVVGGPLIAVLCSGTTILGHCYPVFLNFRGGKGVATAAGIILFLVPDILLILLIVFVITVFISRYVSLGSIICAVLFPILTISLQKPWPYIVLSFIMSALVIFSHRMNISRLRAGTEPKINQKAR
ncbi:MAG: glycerol-3-phosphate 1-O-acyltransferase PlsY [Syntrophomonadaceae bacterium]